GPAVGGCVDSNSGGCTVIVSAGSAVKLDTALLMASAPLLNLKNTFMQTGSDAIKLVQKASLQSTDPLVVLDRSTMNIVNGSLVIANLSRINAQNVLVMNGNSALIINAGYLINLLSSIM